MGDPAGVGPEIIVRALAGPRRIGDCLPVVVGDRKVFEEAISLTGVRLGIRLIQDPGDADISNSDLNLIEIPAGSFKKSRATAEGGRASVKFIEKAVQLALDRKVDAIVTAPITKEALKLAGLSWPGHTEMLAEMTDTKDYAMMLSGGPLRVVLATIHTSIKSVPALITHDTVLKTIRLAKKACDMMGIEDPKIAVAGLNPHAGEAGMFGKEEQTAIIPAMEAAKAEGIPCSGPYPPDTLFHKAYSGGIDIIVCMYHDQGLVPFKALCFDSGVNYTAGLPFVRTSPDHGTGYDIAGKNLAREDSFREAVFLAVDILKKREGYKEMTANPLKKTEMAKEH